MKVKINVTTRDIKLGQRGHYAACPVALACRRHRRMGRTWVLSDHVSCAGYPHAAHLDTVPLPTAARDFIANFDAGLAVAPFRFTLVLP
jgi:hypothetical protein